MDDNIPGLIFEKGIFLLLQKLCNIDETIEEFPNKAEFSFYTKTGIFSLGINPKSYIEVLYVKDNSVLNFKNLLVRWIWRNQDYLNRTNIVIITNLSSYSLHDYVDHSYFDNIGPIRFISIDELSDAERTRSDQDNGDSGNIFDTYKKVISSEKLEEVINNVVRIRILKTILPEQEFIVDKMVTKEGRLLPFGYKDGQGKYHVFIRKKTRFIDKSIMYMEDATVHRIDFKEEDHDTVLIEHDDVIELFNKITRSDFIKTFYIAIGSSRYSFNPNKPQYKYRSFWNDWKERKPFDANNIRPGSRCAIENGSIYFSTRDEINDPFDLDADTSVYGLTPIHNDYRVFCTADKFDNILMWSHYGDSHKGMCTSYLPKDILNTIDADPRIAFAVYGKVQYSKIRKPLLKNMSLLKLLLAYDFLDLILQMQSLFRKYQDWEYENEFRYIVSLNELVDKMTMIVPPKEFYFGQVFEFEEDVNLYLFSYIHKNCYSFFLSKTKYKLELRSVALP